MKQALHIFLKDVRRLWMEIAGVMLAIAYFAVLDILYTVLRPFGTDTLIIEFIVGASVWFLIARAVHEESLTGENEFWPTRPYERGSLLGAKIMMAVLAVAVPLFVADCVILSVQSLPVTENLGGLVLRQLMTATWLILPPFAIASVTRSIAEDVMVWLVALTVAIVAYFPQSHFRAADGKYALAGALALMVIAASRQYWRRGTTLMSRALIAAAVLLQALPLPESTALAIEGSRAPEISNITVTPQAPLIRTLGWNSRRGRCTAVPLSMGRARSNWRLEVRSQNSTFESADGKTWNTGWLPPDQGPTRYGWTDAVIYSCISPDGLSVLGAGTPLTLHVSVALEIFAENAPISVKATLAPFEVPGVGRCQFSTDPRSQNYMLACKAPIWFPPPGTIEISTAQWAYPPISSPRYAWTPMNLLPGLSPVYKWTTISSGLAASIREAIEHGGELGFRTETRIGLIRREVVVK